MHAFYFFIFCMVFISFRDVQIGHRVLLSVENLDTEEPDLLFREVIRRFFQIPLTDTNRDERNYIQSDDNIFVQTDQRETYFDEPIFNRTEQRQ